MFEFVCAALIWRHLLSQCQVLVEIKDVPVGADLPNLLIAKTFDPRFNYERKNTFSRRSPIPWSAAKEKAAADRRAFALGDDFSIPQWERERLVVRRICYHKYESSSACEAEAYRRLWHLRGSTIPWLYGSGRVALGHGEGRAISPRVLFIEYIPGPRREPRNHPRPSFSP